jgi:hypothetical protein
MRSSVRSRLAPPSKFPKFRELECTESQSCRPQAAHKLWRRHASPQIAGLDHSDARITACSGFIAAHYRLRMKGEGGKFMPEKRTIKKARKDARQGKSPSTQAGEFVREEMHHIRGGKHGARSTKQAIAIGLSKARRSGVKLRSPRRGKASAKTRAQASRELRRGTTHPKRKPSARRSRAVTGALRREGHSAASRSSLSRQARSTARARGRTARHRSAMKAVRTKGAQGRSASARKAAQTRSGARR